MIKKIHINLIDSFEKLGETVVELLWHVGFTIIVMFKTIYHLKSFFEKRAEIVDQMYITGVKSLFVCGIVAFFTGMVLSLQVGIQIKPFGQEELIGGLMVTTMIKEMGPFTTALILTASVGSAISAEIGTMKVSEEIDALEMMSISPIKYLVMSRSVALWIMLPVVSIYTNFWGVIGGAIVSKFQLGLSFDLYFSKVYNTIYFKDMYVSLIKAFVFGITIAAVSSANGLIASGGALGVGRATRRSVVSSFLLILVLGYFITAIFYGGDLNV